MTDIFPQIAILGGGLLGGSLALALASQENPPQVRLWARRAATLDDARQRGIGNATSHLGQAVAGVDLVILAVPVGSMPELVSAAMAAGLPDSCLVTDVGSVKQVPHQTLTPILARQSIPFIGSHPMAGSERVGIAAASSSLFDGSACLLTNDDQAPAALAVALDRFWRGIGCHTTWMSAAAHDALVARISHLPHILAACGARICLEDPALGRFGGGGLRDTTRVASGNAEMWAEILIENRRSIIEPLRASISDLATLLASLEAGNQVHTRDWLNAAKQRRDALSQQP
jgi:prephenate dehydrogenase